MPVLLTEDMMDALMMLVDNCDKLNILPSNPYIFACPSQNSYLQGTDIL